MSAAPHWQTENMRYQQLINDLAQEIIVSTRWGRPPTSVIHNLYERLGEAPQLGHTSAQAYDDVLALARAAPARFDRVREAMIRRAHLAKRRAERGLQESVFRPIQESIYLPQLPALRASLEGPGAPRVPTLPAGHAPQASIVMLSFNRLDYLKTTLAAFHATIGFEDYELIVVDNGSTDGTADFLREAAERRLCSKVILRAKNHGISPGYNVGFAHAAPGTGCLVKLDSDIVMQTPRWLPRILQLLRNNPRIGALCTTVVNHAHLRASTTTEVGGERLVDWQGWVIGAAGMCIPRRVFTVLGGFCEDFEYKYHPDDVDYYVRLVRAGYDAFYVRGLRAYHRKDLDQSTFVSYDDAKKADLARWNQTDKLGRGYDRRERPLGLFYPRYEGCQFPEDRRLIEIDRRRRRAAGGAARRANLIVHSHDLAKATAALGLISVTART